MTIEFLYTYIFSSKNFQKFNNFLDILKFEESLFPTVSRAIFEYIRSELN